MTLYIEENGEDRWIVRLAPQCAADILIQIYDAPERDDDGKVISCATFTFKIGDLIRETIEDNCYIDGTWRASKREYDILQKYAAHLEMFASMIRNSISVRKFTEDEESVPKDP